MIGLAAPASAQSDDTDTQFWIYAIAETELDDATELALDVTSRWRGQTRGNEQQTLRFNLTHRIAQGVNLGGGAGVFETEGGTTEIRPHQEIDLSIGRFSSRTRLEERFFDGADRMELRIRQRVGYTQPISADVSLDIDGEYLRLLQRRERAGDRPRNEWRARAILTANVNERLALGAGFLRIHTPRDDAPTRISNVPQAYLTLTF